MAPSWYRMIVHCAAKQAAATVATERPISTLDSQVSNGQVRTELFHRLCGDRRVRELNS